MLSISPIFFLQKKMAQRSDFCGVAKSAKNKSKFIGRRGNAADTPRKTADNKKDVSCLQFLKGGGGDHSR
jgi:hypothetical protein